MTDILTRAFVWLAVAGCSSGTSRASPYPALCSGCPGEVRTDSDVHFHHVHLNTTDPATTTAYFEKMFFARQVRLNDRADVLKADGALILLNPVSAPPVSELTTGVEHMGWGTTDVDAWLADAQGRGVVLDPGGPATPAELYPGFKFIYLQGPEKVRIEVNTFNDYEFSHVHFMTDDVDKTVAFYESLLGVSATLPAAQSSNLFSFNSIVIDHINMIYFGPPYPVPSPFQKMDDHPIGHIAFSFPDLDQAFRNAKALGAEAVSEPQVSAEFGFRSAFVRGPNLVLIELVQAGRIPNP